jgi:hypothetical protein
VAIGIRGTVGIDVVARSFHTVMESAVPCLGPVAFGLDWLPGSRRWTLLCMNSEWDSA